MVKNSTPRRISPHKRLLLILLAIIASAGLLVWQRNYQTIPDYVPPLTQLPEKVLEKTTTVVAVGDIACSSESSNFNGGEGNLIGCHMKQTAELARSLKPEALLLLGDLQYENGELEQFQQSYAKSWGAEDLLKISRPAPGNHEYNTKNAAGYYAYFGAAAGDPTKGYYSFSIGDWHVVSLNSNCKFVACDEGSQQLTWLENDLKQNVGAKCSIGFFHHPLFSSGSHGRNDAVRPLYAALDKNGVDVVLAGHDHLYERLAPQNSAGVADPNGIRSFVVGTGGKSRYPFREAETNSEARISSADGVLRLDLAKDGYTWQFIDTNNKVLDTGSDTCK